MNKEKEVSKLIAAMTRDLSIGRFPTDDITATAYISMGITMFRHMGYSDELIESMISVSLISSAHRGKK